MRLFVFASVGVGLLAMAGAAQAGSSGLKPSLQMALAQISVHYGRSVEITSGCRSVKSNRMAGGRKSSYHLRCMAADIRVPGVSEGQLLAYVKSMSIIGGVGTYCRNTIVHIDVGPKRQWGGCGKRRHALKAARRVQLAGN